MRPTGTLWLSNRQTGRSVKRTYNFFNFFPFRPESLVTRITKASKECSIVT